MRRTLSTDLEMTRKEKSNGHKTETPDVSHIRNVEVTHETSDINVRGVLTFVVVLTIATIAVCSRHVVVVSVSSTRRKRKEPRPGPMALTPGGTFAARAASSGSAGFRRSRWKTESE